MKCKIQYILVLVLSAVLYGCTDENDGWFEGEWSLENHALYIDGYYYSEGLEINFPVYDLNNDHTQYIDINTDGTTTNWKISGVPEWLSVSSTSGNRSERVGLTLKSTLSNINNRIATITVTSSDMPGSFEIRAIQDIYLEASAYELEFDAQESKQTIDISTNVDWEIDNTSFGWGYAEKVSNSQLVIQVYDNNDYSRRDTSIGIIYSDEYNNQRYEQIYISQKSLYDE